MSNIDEIPGHHIHDRPLDDVVHLLRCECGWGPFPTHSLDVDDTKQLHWAAKICEADIVDLESAIETALAQLDEPDWMGRLLNVDGDVKPS